MARARSHWSPDRDLIRGQVTPGFDPRRSLGATVNPG
jgi:hypothetical protein